MPINKSEELNSWINSVGPQRTNEQWLLSRFNTWERNPYYTGPGQRHPLEADDDDYYDDR